MRQVGYMENGSLPCYQRFLFYTPCYDHAFCGVHTPAYFDRYLLCGFLPVNSVNHPFPDGSGVGSSMGTASGSNDH